jgi:hypothetical protein
MTARNDQEPATDKAPPARPPGGHLGAWRWLLLRVVTVGGRLSLRLALVELDDQRVVSIDMYHTDDEFIDGIVLDLAEAAEAGRALLDLAGTE